MTREARYLTNPGVSDWSAPTPALHVPRLEPTAADDLLDDLGAIVAFERELTDEFAGLDN